jgi:hypothetical protein
MKGYEPIVTTVNNETKYFTFGGSEIPIIMDITTFVGKNIPALKPESNVWCMRDYETAVSFDLQQLRYPDGKVKVFSSTWASVSKMFLDHADFGGNLDKTNLFEGSVIQIPKGETFENAELILVSIKDKIKWNKKGGIDAEDIKDALQKREGGRGDINFLLINALRTAGMDAYPVVLRTRDRGMLRTTNPSVNAFNRLVTGLSIGEKTYFTDASDEYSDWNTLPPETMVPNARKIDINGSAWIDLSTVSTGSELYNVHHQFIDGYEQATVTDTKKGNCAYDFRKKYADEYEGDKNKCMEELASEHNAVIENFNIENDSSSNEDLKLIYVVKKEWSPDADYLYVTPLSALPFRENPFKSEERIVPINFDYILNHAQLININIPEGYTVEELPTSAIYAFDEENSINFVYRIMQTGDKIVLRYQVILKRLLFLPDEYPILRDFFAKVVAKNTEQIVLKKTTEE